MKVIVFICLILFPLISLAATTTVNVDIIIQHIGTAGTDLRVSANSRYLTKGNVPFFFLSDTEWVLNARTDNDVVTILDDRVTKGFTVVQVFATRDFTFGGSGDISKDVNGNLPFINNDPTQFNVSYWNRWRSIADLAAARKLYFLLVYGEPGRDYPHWRCASSATCYEYGRHVGDTFKDKSNIIFCNGYDSHATTDTSLWRAMAEGVADGVNGVNNFDGSADYSTTMMTYHGYDNETFQSDNWLDFYGTEVWGNIAFMYDSVSFYRNLSNPTKPSMILEGDYEGYSYPDVLGNPYWTRVQAYHTFFAGGGGYAYGNNFNYMSPSFTPLAYLASSGADGMRVFSSFMQSRNWWKMTPDQTIVSSPGSGTSRKAAMRSTDGDECLIYYPTVSSTTINMGCITSTNSVGATWFDPRNGGTQDAGTFPRTQQVTMQPPGGWEDAVLDLRAR